MDNLKTCKNCDSKITSNYCENCGQRTSINKVTFSETFNDIIDAMFSLDAPLWRTIKTLIVNPGKLFRDFLCGKRKTYYKPVSFFILTTIIYVIVKTLLNYDPMQNIAQVQHESLDISLFNKAGVFMAKNINNIIFTFVFSFAIMMKVFFFKKYSLPEYLAVSFYIVGFYIIITTLMIFGLKFGNPQYKMLPFILLLVYVLYALSSFFQKKSLLTIIKTFLVYFFAIVLYMFLGYGISFLIVWLKSV
ncbi:DUF3667 domain-containing protein [Ichthyenterobacterium magnum]|uniref:Uncharacterized protein DUF3667 n=1 Tax=Ichthyenterobacterium magnum TaxID=1230530 RepID=A0A420DW54_9FLAO|nr:DUF3667 domain-containing protein [Ichthyenterobacterium magnum]RKE98460.1 uncharacterized protein DUF3667 [Ichthyenterobacterium magnum]